MAPVDKAKKVLERERERIMGMVGVVGVGLGIEGDEPAIVVMCEHKKSAAAKRLPSRIDGVRVIVERTDPIVAH